MCLNPIEQVLRQVWGPYIFNKIFLFCNTQRKYNLIPSCFPIQFLLLPKISPFFLLYIYSVSFSFIFLAPFPPPVVDKTTYSLNLRCIQPLLVTRLTTTINCSLSTTTTRTWQWRKKKSTHRRHHHTTTKKKGEHWAHWLHKQKKIFVVSLFLSLWFLTWFQICCYVADLLKPSKITFLNELFKCKKMLWGSNFKFNFQIFQKQRDDNKLMGHGGHGIHVFLVGWDLGLVTTPLLSRLPSGPKTWPLHCAYGKDVYH